MWYPDEACLFLNDNVKPDSAHAAAACICNKNIVRVKSLACDAYARFFKEEVNCRYKQAPVLTLLKWAQTLFCFKYN